MECTEAGYERTRRAFLLQGRLPAPFQDPSQGGPESGLQEKSVAEGRSRAGAVSGSLRRYVPEQLLEAEDHGALHPDGPLQRAETSGGLAQAT